MASATNDDGQNAPAGGEASGAGSPTSMHIRRAVQGDRDSLDWIVVRFSPLLKAQAAWRLGPRMRAQIDPDDVVSSAWLVALTRLDGMIREDMRASQRLLAFLGATVLNIVNRRIDDAVRAARRMEHAPADGAPSDVVAGLEATVTGALTRAARNEFGAALETCLAGLADQDREVILLRLVEGLSNDEAARIVGDAPNTVSHRYRRALAKLREALPASFLDEIVE